MAPLSDKTVKEVLADSLAQNPIADGQFNEIYAIKSPEFDDYLLRVKQPYISDLRKHLESTTALTPPYLAALTVPDFLFTGPNVSQSLLHLGASKNDDPVLEIIPKQKGVMLCHYVLGPNDSFDRDTRRTKRLELMEELGKPESDELKNIFMQAALVSQQHPSFPYLDVNDGTIMVEKDTKGGYSI